MVSGRTALVSGGGGGIGRSIGRCLARSGHRVIAVGRDRQRLVTLAEGAEREALDIAGHRCDITDEDEVAALVEQLGPVDVLVNSAGIAETDPVHRVDLSAWQRHLQANTTGPMLLTRAVLPGMRERGWGRIVTVASTAAKIGTPYTAAYAASKHAALGLTRVVAAETAGTQVTSNAVCPGFVRTEMTQRSVERIVARSGRTPAEAEAELAAATPLGRLVEPAEVAAAVEYLVSDAAGCVNGQSLVLDGGGIQA